MNYEQAIYYIEQTDTPRQRYGLEKLKQALPFWVVSFKLWLGPAL